MNHMGVNGKQIKYTLNTCAKVIYPYTIDAHPISFPHDNDDGDDAADMSTDCVHLLMWPHHR